MSGRTSRQAPRGPRVGAAPGRPPGAVPPVLIALAVLALLVWGCAPFPRISADERAALRTGERAVVLVRILCTVDGKPFAPCLYRTGDAPLSDPLFVGFALGGFETLGEPGPAVPRALSEESLAAGWAAFVLDPGIHYLSVRGPDSSESGRRGDNGYDRAFAALPRWRIDVPPGTKGLYAGTLHLAGERTGTLLLGDPIIRPANPPEIPLTDQGALALPLLRRHLPEAGEVRTLLMRPWPAGEPVRLRAPLSAPAR